MKIKNTEYYGKLKFKDKYGNVSILIQNDLSQISIASENGDCFADTDINSIKSLRDMLNEKIESYEKN